MIFCKHSSTHTHPRIWLSGRYWALAAIIALFGASPPGRAVEVLSVHELVSHCQHLAEEPEGVDAQFCIRYIQGFVDGAVATDVQVMLNAEDDREETFTERAIRTRAPSAADEYRASRLAGFCLWQPLPLRDVVERVVADLVEMDIGGRADNPARGAIYESLQAHYPCTDD